MTLKQIIECDTCGRRRVWPEPTGWTRPFPPFPPGWVSTRRERGIGDDHECPSCAGVREFREDLKARAAAERQRYLAVAPGSAGWVDREPVEFEPEDSDEHKGG